MDCTHFFGASVVSCFLERHEFYSSQIRMAVISYRAPKYGLRVFLNGTSISSVHRDHQLCRVAPLFAKFSSRRQVLHEPPRRLQRKSLVRYLIRRICSQQPANTSVCRQVYVVAKVAEQIFLECGIADGWTSDQLIIPSHLPSTFMHRCMASFQHSENSVPLVKFGNLGDSK